MCGPVVEAFLADFCTFHVQVYDLLKISDKPGEDGSLNSGNGVTDAVKVQVKANRLVGVHVTPVSLRAFFFPMSFESRSRNRLTVEATTG